MHSRVRTHMILLTVFGFVLATVAGCAHVKRDELATDLDGVRAELRAEQEAGDEELGSRIDAAETRLGGRLDAVERRQSEVEERLDRLEGALRELETELGVTIQRLENAIAFHVPVYFDFDSSLLEDAQTEVLDRFAAVYDEFYGNDLLTVEGFTDEAGSQEYNKLLGKRRAEAVKSYLTEIAGLNPERVRTVSYGESTERLVTPGRSGPVEGWENRRVVLVIDAPSGLASSGDAGEGR